MIKAMTSAAPEVTMGTKRRPPKKASQSGSLTR